MVTYAACEAQLNRAFAVAGLMRVPWQAYQRSAVKRGFQEFCIGAVTQHYAGSAVTCVTMECRRLLKQREGIWEPCAMVCCVIILPPALIEFNSVGEFAFARHVFSTVRESSGETPEFVAFPFYFCRIPSPYSSSHAITISFCVKRIWRHVPL